jgi:hypothetical protein
MAVEAIIDLLMKPQTEMQVATSTSANAGITLCLPLALFVRWMCASKGGKNNVVGE